MDAAGVDEIKIVAVVFHTHLKGIRVRVRHFRDEDELPLISKDDNYDFNFQDMRKLPEEVSVLKVVNVTYRQKVKRTN